jgi:hypothetical protein
VNATCRNQLHSFDNQVHRSTYCQLLKLDIDKQRNSRYIYKPFVRVQEIKIKLPEASDLRKLKFILEQATKAQKGSRGTALLFLQHRVSLWVGGQRHATAVLPPGMKAGTQCRGWATGAGCMGAENLTPYWDSIPGPSTH